MSRILLLLVFLLWMTGTAKPTPRPPGGPWLDTALFLGFYAILVVGMGLWSRMLARRVAASNFSRSLRRFNQMMLVARLLIPAWFGFGVFALGWGWVIQDELGLAALGMVKLPGLVLGTLPALLAWAGLWWSQYPAERALREQHVWNQLEDGEPLHAPPRFGEYFSANLRLQVLFTLVPILLIVGTRDVAALLFFDHPTAHQGDAGAALNDKQRIERENAEEVFEFVSFLASAGLVFVLAPEILRRVLKTSPLPEGPLRRRLEALCRRTGMRCRDILVWHTQFNMGNAAVMGVVPQVRYVLLSDLLLERMDDEQIEAVFAHEIGHVVHRHMVWYVLFFLTLLLATLGPFRVASDWLGQVGLWGQLQDLAVMLAGVGGFWLLFGFISRRFERQADVYAARVIESAASGSASPMAALAAGASGMSVFAGGGAGSVAAAATDVTAAAPAHHADSHVGRYGATLFASALHRVAMINNIPISPRSPRHGGLLQRVGYLLGSFMDLAHDWLHGSIPHRMAYLHTLSTDPALTGRFDRVMARLYCTLLFCLCASAAWTWMALAGVG